MQKILVIIITCEALEKTPWYPSVANPMYITWNKCIFPLMFFPYLFSSITYIILISDLQCVSPHKCEDKINRSNEKST